MKFFNFIIHHSKLKSIDGGINTFSRGSNQSLLQGGPVLLQTTHFKTVILFKETVDLPGPIFSEFFLFHIKPSIAILTTVSKKNTVNGESEKRRMVLWQKSTKSLAKDLFRKFDEEGEKSHRNGLGILDKTPEWKTITSSAAAA